MATQALVTSQDVMDYGNLDNEALRPRIEFLLKSVWASAEQYCDRVFSGDTFTEYQDGKGQTEFYILNPPISTIVSLTDNAQLQRRAIDLTNVMTMQEYKDRGRVKLFRFESMFLQGFNGGLAGIEIVYRGGYTEDTFPQDLKEAICMEVLYRLDGRTVGVKSQSADGVSATAS